MLLLQIVSSALLIALQGADAAHTVPILGRLVPRERLDGPRIFAQGGLAFGAVVLPWKLVLALIALQAKRPEQPSVKVKQMLGL